MAKKTKSTVELMAGLIARQQPTPAPDLTCPACKREGTPCHAYSHSRRQAGR